MMVPLHQHFQLSWVRSHTISGYYLTKNGTNIHLKWHLALLSFRFICPHICSTFCSVSSWSLPLLSYPTTKMPSTKTNSFGKSLNIFFYFSLKHISLGATPNGNVLYMYLPNWHAISHLASGCDIQSLHLLEKDILHFE